LVLEQQKKNLINLRLENSLGLHMRVLVIAQNDKLAINVIRCLRMAGMTACLMGADSRSVARFSRYCAIWIKADGGIFNAPFTGAVGQIDDCCEQQGIDLVMGADMPAVRMLSSIHARLTRVKTFPLASPEQLQMLHNKWLFSQFLREQHLPVPATVLVKSEDELTRIPLEYPLIVKPVEMEGGAGVKKLNSPTDARAHLLRDNAAHRLPLLFQEFIPGIDVGLSVLANQGEIVAWTIQKWLSTGALEFVADEQVLALGKKITAASGFHGVAHFDMRRDERDGAVKILECNPRFWASLRESMWNGTNFVEQGIRLAQDRLLDPMINRRITYVFPARALVSSIKGNLFGLRQFSIASLRDAWQTCSDPLVLACQIKQKWSKHHRLSRDRAHH
jgi:predicted ATP-grasp superfamily ATP-dependent carboligase